MLTLRENAMKIYNHEHPDFYGDIMEAITLVPDPVLMQEMIPKDGKEYLDDWGVTWCFKPGAPGKHPVITDENKVIKDIEHWREYVKVPSLEGLDWGPAIEAANNTNRKEKFVGFMFSGGLFERSHFLMGLEDALCSYMEYPDEMSELLRVIADYKIAYIRLAAEKFHPDIIFYHDDWGSKQNVFLPPRVWREIIKPIQTEIAQVIHECGMIYMHHSDCICQPIVSDMVDIGIDIWQGVIAQNDILAIQKVTQGRLAMVGGIDGPAIDLDGVSEETIRAEVRRAIDTYCPEGRFYPAIPNGRCFLPWNNSIYLDELKKYGREYAEKHPF